MKGIQYFFDGKGRPRAVLIDLRKHGKLWEDFQDIVVARQRRKEPRLSMAEVDARLRKLGKIA